MDREMLQFLFVGPLFSIYKVLNEIRRTVMALRDDLRQLKTDLDGALDNIAADQQRLEEKLANTPAAEDVSAELDALRASVNRAKGLDIPDPVAADTGTAPAGPAVGSVVPPNVSPTPGEGETVAEPLPGSPQIVSLPNEADPSSVTDASGEPVAPTDTTEDGGTAPDPATTTPAENVEAAPDGTAQTVSDDTSDNAPAAETSSSGEPATGAQPDGATDTSE